MELRPHAQILAAKEAGKTASGLLNLHNERFPLGSWVTEKNGKSVLPLEPRFPDSKLSSLCHGCHMFFPLFFQKTSWSGERALRIPFFRMYLIISTLEQMPWIDVFSWEFKPHSLWQKVLTIFGSWKKIQRIWFTFGHVQ